MEVLSRSEHQNNGRVAKGAPSVAAPLRPAVSSFWDLHAYACVRSTNELVKEALRQGVPEGYCNGLGARRRLWTSRKGLGQPFGRCIHFLRIATQRAAANAPHFELGRLIGSS